MTQLTGIANINEFYSHHYLDAILTDDLKNIAKKWQEEADNNQTKTPPILLKSISQDYFTILNQWSTQTDAGERLKLQQQWVSKFLEILGYQFSPQLKPLADKEISLPLTTALQDIADKTAYQNILNLERSLVHVAATRAKQLVTITYYGQPSPFLIREVKIDLEKDSK